MRVVADMVRGKSVSQARLILGGAAKKAKSPLGDLLDSAVANAKHDFKLDADRLTVKEIRVDQGFVLRRYMPVSRGSSHPIKKRTSHVKIVLAPIEDKKPKAKAPKAKQNK